MKKIKVYILVQLREKFSSFLKKNNNTDTGISKKSHSLTITGKEKLFFLESFSNLLNSWIPITNGLKIMIYQTKSKKLLLLLQGLLENTNKWKTLESSFSSYPKIFNHFDTSLIQMWELTWKLWEVIETIKMKEEKSRELEQKVVGALVYPSVIVTLATVMIVVFLVYVIPKITDMYKDAKVNLPDLTQSVINLSKFLQDNYTLLIVCVILLLIWIITFKRHKKTKIYWDQYILKTPLFWPLIQKQMLALFCSSMWTLLSQWVMINQALRISARSLQNDYYEKEILSIEQKISAWESLSDLMWINSIASKKTNSYFPIELSSIVKIWEQTGKMPSLLKKISIKYNKEIDVLVKNLSTAIEPIIIVFVWCIIGTLIMAVMLPFFNMVNVI